MQHLIHNALSGLGTLVDPFGNPINNIPIPSDLNNVRIDTNDRTFQSWLSANPWAAALGSQALQTFQTWILAKAQAKAGTTSTTSTPTNATPTYVNTYSGGSNVPVVKDNTNRNILIGAGLSVVAIGAAVVLGKKRKKK